ncbi:MAG TPA: type II toxin-antitoxin system HicA family toxin [Dehalococcoidia bacterium]|nr:type II toxin-antitoxin system HicA family toxin [Dehalococcoidia bacterium]
MGFSGPRGGGDHLYMQRGALKVPVPNPHGSSFSVALIRRIVRRAGITPEEWDSLDRR